MNNRFEHLVSTCILLVLTPNCWYAVVDLFYTQEYLPAVLLTIVSLGLTCLCCVLLYTIFLYTVRNRL